MIFKDVLETEITYDTNKESGDDKGPRRHLLNEGVAPGLNATWQEHPLEYNDVIWSWTDTAAR